MKLLNTNRFYLSGTNNRFIHIATIEDGLREYLAFFDSIEKKLYIEAISASGLTFIDDDKLAEDLASFLFHKKVTDLTQGDMTVDN